MSFISATVRLLQYVAFVSFVEGQYRFREMAIPGVDGTRTRDLLPYRREDSLDSRSPEPV